MFLKVREGGRGKGKQGFPFHSFCFLLFSFVFFCFLLISIILFFCSGTKGTTSSEREGGRLGKNYFVSRNGLEKIKLNHSKKKKKKNSGRKDGFN